jgi:hypothetical protein
MGGQGWSHDPQRSPQTASGDESMSHAQEAGSQPEPQTPMDAQDGSVSTPLEGPLSDDGRPTGHVDAANGSGLRVSPLLFIGGAVVVLALGFLIFRSGGQTIEGSFTVVDGRDTLSELQAMLAIEGGEDLDPCTTSGGYSDVRAGTNVTLRDGANEIIGTSSLGPGMGTDGVCRFEFVLENVPDRDFYTIEVGRRGTLTYSRDEMRENDWQVGLSLGG